MVAISKVDHQPDLDDGQVAIRFGRECREAEAARMAGMGHLPFDMALSETAEFGLEAAAGEFYAVQPTQIPSRRYGQGQSLSHGSGWKAPAENLSIA